MIICELEMSREDPSNPGYSMSEPDYYAWIPQRFVQAGMPNHRLTLRKNIAEGKYEFYRAYHRRVTGAMIIANNPVAVITHKESGIEEVIFSTEDFAEALKFGDAEWNKYHWKEGEEKHEDKVCTHGDDWRTTSSFCPRRYEKRR